MNLFVSTLFLLTEHFRLHFLLNISRIKLSHDYAPLYYSTLETLIITNPCHTNQSILIRNRLFYKFDREQSRWKRLCVSEKISQNQTSTVNAIAHLHHDLILIIDGQLFRTQDILSLSTDEDIVYRLLRYSNVPIFFEKIDHAFATPCCACSPTTDSRSISHVFNDYVILGNRSGNVILFNLKSRTMVNDFGNLFQGQSICQGNACAIQSLGLIHSQPILICILQYQIGKTIIFHQPFLDFNSTTQKSTFLNFTGDLLHITASSIPNAYFLWDEKKISYTPNGGQILSEIVLNGCQIDYLNTLDEEQLKDYYQTLGVDYDNITLFTKEIFCLNITIDHIFVSNHEFFILTKTNQWLYGKESFFPSMIALQPHCVFNQSLPHIDPQCLLNLSNPSFPCSSFVQSYCSYIRFEALFDVKQIYILEKFEKRTWRFVLESYTIIPIMISSTPSSSFNYSISYEINRLKNGIIQRIGSICISTTNQANEEWFGSSMISLRLGLIQYGYSCQQMPSFSFQIEASCSPTSVLRVEKTNEFDHWNYSNSINDIEWLRHNLPTSIIRQFSPVYIKCKQTDSIILKYQYCSNQTCQSLNHTQLGFFLIYAIPLNRKHEDNAHYLFNRTDSCTPLSRLIYRLWIKWTLNSTSRGQLFQIAYERPRFYQTLLNTLSITNKSCLFFNASNPLHINQTINQASEEDSKFLLHIIAYQNSFSFCDLETFLLIEIEPNHILHNSYRGSLFLITLFLFLLFFLSLIHLYTYYKNQQRKKYLEYHRLNQMDAGQFHQWHDLARYLHVNENTEHYFSLQQALLNLPSSSNLTERLLESHR